MRRVVLILAIVVAACSGGEADVTTTASATVPATTTTAAPPTTTSTIPASTTTSSSTTTTVATTVPPGFTTYTHPLFSVAHPEAWSENPEFPGFGVGFIQDHADLALPATDFAIYLEEQEPGFDLDANIVQIQNDLAFFVPDFRILRSGEETIDGAPSRWFEYADDIDGFPIVIREETALRDDLLVTFTLISPVEFFEFDVAQVEHVVGSFTFS